MKILAIDTATEACSVALSLDSDTVTHRFDVCPQQHSQRLLPMVDEVLKAAGVSLSDLDALAYGRGPGSFTGVRIATGMIQGLSLGTGLEVAGISTLSAMAQQSIEQSGSEYVACAIDARMGEVYFAVYKNENGLATLFVEEQVCPPDVAADLLKTVNNAYDCVGTGWDAYAILTPLRGENDVAVLYPSAQFMVEQAKVMANQGQLSHAANIEPVYLRDKVTWKKLPGRE